MSTITRAGNTYSAYWGSRLIYSTSTTTYDIAGINFGSAFGNLQKADILYFSLYDRALSSGEVRSIATEGASYFDNKAVVLVGNSHYAGYNSSSGHDPYSQIRARLDAAGKSHWPVRTNYFSGRTGLDMVNSLHGYGQLDIDSSVNFFNGPSVVFLTEMTNDVAVSTDSQTVDHMFTVADTLRLIGDTHVVFHPEMARYAAPADLYDSSVPNTEAYRNGLIRAGASHFDEIMAIDADPHLGQPGANFDPVFFSSFDRIHLTNYGYDYLIGNYMWPAVQRQLLNEVFTNSVPQTLVASTSAVIEWETNQPAYSKVNFGFDGSYGTSTVLVSEYASSHSVTLTSLVPCTVYHFQTYATNGSGLVATSSDQTFSTTGCPEGRGTINIDNGPISAINASWWADYSQRNGLAASTTASTTPARQSATSTSAIATTSIATSLFLPLVTSPDLQLGTTSPYVLLLQQFLNSNGFTVSTSGLGSPSQETTYFGTKTRDALRRFQKANRIIPSAGYFGPKTRAVVKNLI